MRKMFDPMADIRKSVLGDGTTQRLIRELTDGSSIRNQIKEITERALGIGSVAKLLAQQSEESRAQTKKFLEGIGVGRSIQSYVKATQIGALLLWIYGETWRCQAMCQCAHHAVQGRLRS